MNEPVKNSSNPDADDMHGPRQLSVGVSQFVEYIGMLMERYGMPRIGGRIMGLFMLDEEPLSLDDIARLLGVSRASVSTNVRLSEISGFAKRVARPGDRRDYYVGAEDAWTQSIKTSKRDVIAQMAEAARAAIPNVPTDDLVAHQHLQEIIDFSAFISERLEQLLTEWENRKAELYPNKYNQNKGEPKL